MQDSPDMSGDCASCKIWQAILHEHLQVPFMTN